MLKRPERLFRYYPPEESDFFTEKKLWFSSLKDFHDPFDALPRFDTMLANQSREAIKKEFASLPPQVKCDLPTYNKGMSRDASAFNAEMSLAVAEQYRELVSKDYRLVCFSENPDDLLMWERYARGHTGFVIEFNPKHQIFSTEEFGQVDYLEADERPDVENQDQGKEEYWKILFRKSRHLDYEREWRLVKLATSLPPSIERRGKFKHFLELPVDSIYAVYFGWQLPPENRAKLVESLKSLEWKDVKKFVMCPDAAKYSVRPVPLGEWLSRSQKYAEYKLALDEEIQTRLKSTHERK
jgi:hypothetical protein